MTLAPVAPTERIQGVDIARGIALLGILFVNARSFFSPLGFAMEPWSSIDGSELTPADTAAWFFVDTFCTFKFISLFSMLFGFGLAMQAERAARAGQSPWPAALRRLALLAFVGLLHWTLVWSGDILMIYAILGVAVLACTQWSRRTVGIIAVVLSAIVAVLAVLLGGLSGLGVALRPDDVSSEMAASELTKRGFDAMMAAQFDPYDPAWLEAERAAFAEGPFLDALLFRCVLYAYGFAAALFSYGWHALLMMVCGVYAFKAGLFSAGGSAFRRRIAPPALALGLVLTASGTVAMLVLGADSVFALIAYTALLSLGAMVLPFGYAAAIVEWGPKLPSVVATALERTGRMSFTVYLSESLLCTALASWWGLAWFGSVGNAQAAMIALIVWLALVCFATAWLAVFRIGPFEWLWRMVTYAGNPGVSRPNLA